MEKFLLNLPFRFFASLASRGHFQWLNEKLAVKLIYHGQMGKALNLRKPQSFNEKLQWLKLYDRKPLYTHLVDKCEVRSYIEKWLGSQYLIPLIKTWNSVDEIKFEELPSSFVLKCTHDSGSAIVCREKSALNTTAVLNHFRYRLSRSHYWGGIEWPYKNVKPKIIAEKYMCEAENDGLTDYKFYCFNSKPMFLYVSKGLENHETAEISFFDLNAQKMPFRRSDYRELSSSFQVPSKFEEMKEIANVCAKNIGAPFVRVDLYQIKEQVYFSEFTFTPCGGYMHFVPDKYDLIIGEMLKLPMEEKI